MNSAALLRQPSLYERAGFALLAFVLHLFVAIVMWNIKMPQENSMPLVSESGGVKVSIPLNSLAQPTAPAASSAKILSKSKVQSLTAPRIPKEVPTPDVEPQATTVTPTPESSQMLPPLQQSSPFSPNLSYLLPQSNKAYMDTQRDKGEHFGEEGVHNEEVLSGPGVSSQEKLVRPKIVTTEFSTLAYRIDLERRFAEAWGGVRMLPSFSSFVGKVGELIVYNVVVNRDGSLRRIVNVSAIEQAGRDYSSVDSLVQDFADSVFPINPLPSRILEEPFVVRWAIRYMGAQYSFF